MTVSELQLLDSLSRVPLIDSAEACRRYAAIRHLIRREADIAAEHGLTPVSFAIYELLDERSEDADSSTEIRESHPPYRTQLDEETKSIALKVESAIVRHSGVVDWQVNEEIKRLMRRNIKRELRPNGYYTEEQLEDLAARIVELASRRSG